MKAILSVDMNWGIGYKGSLLQRIPEDMKFFKAMTLGKVVVMGRDTFESFPGKKPLVDRVNIVLSRDIGFVDDRLIICRSLEELFKELENYNTEDVFVIGGESVYKQLLPYCSEVYITRFEKEYTADRFFVDLNKEPGWELASEGEAHEWEGVGFRFLQYRNNKLHA